MSNFTKQDILNEIKRTTEENGNIPLVEDWRKTKSWKPGWEYVIE